MTSQESIHIMIGLRQSYRYLYLTMVMIISCINILRPEQNGPHRADNIFIYPFSWMKIIVFWSKFHCILIQLHSPDWIGFDLFNDDTLPSGHITKIPIDNKKSSLVGWAPEVLTTAQWVNNSLVKYSECLIKNMFSSFTEYVFDTRISIRKHKTKELV